MGNDLIDSFLCSLLSKFRISAGSPASGNFLAQLDLDLSLALSECLSVCIYSDERYAAKTGVDHPVDSVASATANADYFYDRGIICLGYEIRNEFHSVSSSLNS